MKYAAWILAIIFFWTLYYYVQQEEKAPPEPQIEQAQSPENTKVSSQPEPEHHQRPIQNTSEHKKTQEIEIEGKVLWQHTEEPVNEVPIKLFQDKKLITEAQSQADGYFHFSNLTQGTYTIRATTTDGSISMKLNLPMEKPLVLKLKPLHRYNLKVIDITSGDVIPNATLVINKKFKTTSNQDGIIPLSLQSAHYKFRLSAENYSMASFGLELNDFQGTFTRDAPTLIDRENQIYVIKLAPAASLLIKVFDEHKSPLKGAYIENRFRMKQDNHHLQVDGIPFGNQQITVAREGYHSQTFTVQTSSKSLYSEKRVYLKEKRTVFLAGKVQDTQGKPIPNATVQTLMKSIKVDHKGNWSMKGKAPESLRFSAPGYRPEYLIFEEIKTRLDQIHITLSLNQRRDGLVQDLQGNPVANAKVNFEKGNRGTGTVTQNNGRFHWQANQDFERIVVTKLGYQSVTISEVPDGPLVITLEPHPHFYGYVIDENEEPITDFWVDYSDPTDSMDNFGIVPDADAIQYNTQNGLFHMPVTAPAVSLTIYAEGYAPKEFQKLEHWSAESPAILKMTKKGIKYQGIVQDEYGKPIEGIRVQVIDQVISFQLNDYRLFNKLQTNQPLFPLHKTYSVLTDAQGRWELTQLNEKAVHGLLFHAEGWGPTIWQKSYQHPPEDTILQQLKKPVKLTLKLAPYLEKRQTRLNIEWLRYNFYNRDSFQPQTFYLTPGTYKIQLVGHHTRFHHQTLDLHEDLSLVLGETISLSGVANNVRNGDISLGSDYSVTATTAADSSGAFEFKDLKTGTYTLFRNAPNSEKPLIMQIIPSFELQKTTDLGTIEVVDHTNIEAEISADTLPEQLVYNLSYAAHTMSRNRINLNGNPRFQLRGVPMGAILSIWANDFPILQDYEIPAQRETIDLGLLDVTPSGSLLFSYEPIVKPFSFSVTIKSTEPQEGWEEKDGFFIKKNYEPQEIHLRPGLYQLNFEERIDTNVILEKELNVVIEANQQQHIHLNLKKAALFTFELKENHIKQARLRHHQHIFQHFFQEVNFQFNGSGFEGRKLRAYNLQPGEWTLTVIDEKAQEHRHIFTIEQDQNLHLRE